MFGGLICLSVPSCSLHHLWQDTMVAMKYQAFQMDVVCWLSYHQGVLGGGSLSRGAPRGRPTNGLLRDLRRHAAGVPLNECSRGCAQHRNPARIVVSVNVCKLCVQRTQSEPTGKPVR